MSGSQIEDRTAAFVELEQARYPDAQWDHSECWIAQDWDEFEPAISWLVARHYIHELWGGGSQKTP